MTGDIRRLESSIDNSLQGKTRDAFIDRIRQLEKGDKNRRENYRIKRIGELI